MSVDAKALVSVEEYLHTDYSPDVDYVDGERVEGNVGGFDHTDFTDRDCSLAPCALPQAHFVIVVEQRVSFLPRASAFRMFADARPGQMQQIFRTPPFIAIEILSPDDRAGDLQKKIKDYLAFGIAYIWVIESPRSAPRSSTCEAAVTSPRTSSCATENPEINLPLPEIFAALQ